MEALKHYLIPFIVFNVLFAATIFGAIKKPMWVRVFLALFFLWASYINSKTAIETPEVYLDYGKLTPVTAYKDFIYGFFSAHIRQIILPIATCQFLIFFGLLLNKNWVRLACMSAALFGIAIAPLGVGSAFPSTISMAIAFFILSVKYEHDFIWKWGQYKRLAI